MAKRKGEVFPGFEQEQITDIEVWGARFDEKRDLIAGLKGEMETAELKLSEAVHANSSRVRQEQGKRGTKHLVYRRGDFNIVVKEGKEKVNVKIGQKSKGDVPVSGAASEAPDEGADA